MTQSVQKVICFLSAMALTWSTSIALATGWPTFDISNLTQALQDAQRQTQEWQESFEQMLNQSEGMAQGAQYEVDAINNAAANTVARTTQTMTDIFNENLAMEAEPAFDACETYSVSRSLEDAACDSLNAVYESSKTTAERLLNTDSDLSPSGRSLEQIESLLKRDDELNQSGEPHAIVRSDLLFGSQGDTYDEISEKSTEGLVELLTGPTVDEVPDDTTLSGKKQTAAYMRKQAFRLLASDTLNQVRQERMPTQTDEPSQMQLLQQFVDDRFGTEEGNLWLQKITNTDPNETEFVTESQVIRSLAQMDAFQNYVQMLQYKTQLRQMSLQAASLLLDIESTFE